MTTNDSNATKNGPTKTADKGTTATSAPANETPATNMTDNIADAGVAAPDATRTEQGFSEEAVSQTPRPMPAPMTMSDEPTTRNQHQRGPIARFLRSLFSHLLFAGVTVAGVLGYLYHAPMLRDLGDTVCADKVLGQWMSTPPGTTLAGHAPASPAPAQTNAPDRSNSTAAAPTAAKETIVVKSQPAAASLSSAEPSASLVPAPGHTTETSASTHTARPDGIESSHATSIAARQARPIANATPPAAQAPPASAPAIKSAARAPAPPAPPSASVAPQPTAATPAVPQQFDTAPAAPQAAAPSDPRGQMLKEWAAAREAFAKGRPEAESAYVNLVQRYPDVPELTGELGNIYFQQGKMGDAANQYYETAQRLIRLGQPGPAACLIEVMRHLDADKAKALEAQTSVPCPVQRSQSNN